MKSPHPVKFFPMFKNTLILTLYLAVWFCAVNFYDDAALHAGAIANLSYVSAIFQGGVFAKFLIFEQTVFPIVINEGASLYWLICRRTTIDTTIALFLRYIFVGLEGALNHHGFIESIRSFGGGDFLHILSIWILFWLIILPYMVFRCLSLAIGTEKIHSIFSGNKI